MFRFGKQKLDLKRKNIETFKSLKMEQKIRNIRRSKKLENLIKFKKILFEIFCAPLLAKRKIRKITNC